MAQQSNIEWTDATWPIVQGCDYESPGCASCYAVPLIWRMMHHPHPGISAPLEGLVEKRNGKLVWTGKVALREDRLSWPLDWKKPQKIFVPSHGDLFHPDVPWDFLDRVFAVMALARRHTFQVLTKRPDRMADYFLMPGRKRLIAGKVLAISEMLATTKGWKGRITIDDFSAAFPPQGNGPHPNIWLGTSVEDNRRAIERRQPMLKLAGEGWLTFVSYEPALERVDWSGWEFLRWMICGGESGDTDRPMHPNWPRAARDWCAAHAIAFYFKQWGAWGATAISGSTGHPVIKMFRDYQHWADKAPGWVGRGDICLDTMGRSLRIGADFMKARDEGTFPVAILAKMGKGRAGAMLDGVLHREFPTCRA